MQPGEKPFLRRIRVLEMELYALAADHTRALRREEEKGYARGLADARKEARKLCI